MDYKKLITQYWEDITKQDEQRLREYFCEDAYIRWHNNIVGPIVLLGCIDAESLYELIRKSTCFKMRNF